MIFSAPPANTHPTPTETSSNAKTLSMGIYVSAAIGLGCYLTFGGFIRFWDDPRTGAAIIAWGFLVVASFLVLIGRKYAYAVGFMGTSLAWPLIFQNEFAIYRFSNSWVAFDVPAFSPPHGGAEIEHLSAKLTILAVGLLLPATFYSLLHLCPLTWRVGKHAVREQDWLVFVVTIFVMATWYVTAASPWRIPIFDAHTINWNARLCVLHVEKRGFQIRETSVAIRSGRNFHITRDDRKLFRYSFQELHSDGAISEEDLLRLQPVIHSPSPSRARLLHYTPPKDWNADRWFVYVQGRPIENLFNVDKSAVPADILAWFYKAQGLDQLDERQVIERDVCLGFCYDPTY